MKALGAGRIFLYLAVVLLLSGETSAPAQRGLALALYLLMGVCSVLLQAIGEAVARRPAENGRRGGWPSRGSIFWGAALVFDVAAQAFVVERAGGATGGFGLLLCLPVLIWGMQQGLAGGSTSAILATAAQIITRGAGGDRIFFDAPAMALLGVFSGLLGRRMQQERELHRATREALVQARLDAGSVIARLSGGLICLDPGGCVTLVNERGRRMLDPFGCFNPEDDLDQIPDEHPLAALARELLDRLRSGIEQSGELQLGQGANAVTLEITTNPIADGAGRPHGMIALFQDLSDRRAREEQRRQKERLALIGELSAGLAHEIRNSLKPLSGSVELLRREMPSGDRTKDALMEIILRESESLENFVTEFLDFARDKKLEMRGLPIERVVGEELVSLNALPNSRFRLVRPAENAPLWVRADRGALRQVVRNLGINALEAGAGPIEVGWRREGQEAVIFVRDYGPGIPEAVLPRVFEPFFTTRPNGTGLGLAIARDLVHRQEGRLTLAPAEGGGARACIFLPLIDPHESAGRLSEAA